GVSPRHDLYTKPKKRKRGYKPLPPPKNYRHWPGGEKLGKTMKVWRVQTKKFPEIDPGLVSDPYGFADSPDAEVISSGHNGKAPDAVALGRQGNLFPLGFSPPPAHIAAQMPPCLLHPIP